MKGLTTWQPEKDPQRPGLSDRGGGVSSFVRHEIYVSTRIPLQNFSKILSPNFYALTLQNKNPTASDLCPPKKIPHT